MTCARAAPDFSMAGCAQRPACGPAVTFDIAHAALVLSRHLARPCKCAASSCSVRRQLQLGARFEVLDVPCRYLAGGTIRGGQQVCNQACYTESYLLWRFRREGWIANKTLQKLAGTNPVIGISSDLSL